MMLRCKDCRWKTRRGCVNEDRISDFFPGLDKKHRPTFIIVHGNQSACKYFERRKYEHISPHTPA